MSASCSFGKSVENILDFKETHSEDYIIRWAFQKRCDHVYDMITNPYQWPTSSKGVTFDPKDIQSGDTIFVRNAPEFFTKMHHKIDNPYLIITMGEWRESVEDQWLDYLDDEKIIAWFSIHGCTRTHPKFHLLPIGVFQRKDIYKERKDYAKLFADLRKQPKTKLLYANHGDLKNKKQDRKDLDAYMADKTWCTYTAQVQGLPFVDYMKEMAQFKFTLSPRGYGIDCYRTWEALLVGSIPVVKHSQLDPLYEGLPILVINEWEELTEGFLNEKYAEIASKSYDLSALFTDYWFKKVDDIREKYAYSTVKNGSVTKGDINEL